MNAYDSGSVYADDFSKGWLSVDLLQVTFRVVSCADGIINAGELQHWSTLEALGSELQKLSLRRCPVLVADCLENDSLNVAAICTCSTDVKYFCHVNCHW